MTPEIWASSVSGASSAAAGVKVVPRDPAVRRAIRQQATELAAQMDADRPPSRRDLEQQAHALLSRLGLAGEFLGFAMVAVSNGFWAGAFASVPTNRRLLLLPHCLSSQSDCAGSYDSVGLICAACGNCGISGLQREAEQLGYQVIVAEGTSSVVMRILEGRADAVLGVACMDSLEKSFDRIEALGIPHVAVPLLNDGCVETEAELDQLRILLKAAAPGDGRRPRSYIPMLRQAVNLFQEPAFSELLDPCVGGADDGSADATLAVQRIAVEYLRDGGKRLRPFITLTSYCVARHGMSALQARQDARFATPPAIGRIALAIEALHKASLVHDDIEDDDDYRYGRQTLHRQHGLGPAVNIGDYLIGMGYHLIASQADALGAECVADILARLSQAHLDLCRGQGAELLWHTQPQQSHRPMDVLKVYALKTAPAFEAALYAGLRAAGAAINDDALRRLSSYLGEGFQIINDLDDWRADDRNKLIRGLDAMAGRPTVLRAFASEIDGGPALLAQASAIAEPNERIDRVRRLYLESGAFAKAERLLDKLRDRALSAAGEIGERDLQELMRFLVRIVLPPLTWSPANSSTT